MKFYHYVFKKINSFYNKSKLFLLKNKKYVSFALYYLLILFLFRVDIASKEIMFEIFDKYRESDNLYKEVIFEGFAITEVRNTGVSFGLFDKIPYGKIILSAISISVVVSFFVYLHLSKNRFQKVSICFVIAGGFGNFYDRVKLGYVRDFIDLYYKNYEWPVFNVADIYVCIGCLLLLYVDIKSKSKFNKKNNNDS